MPLTIKQVSTATQDSDDGWTVDGHEVHLVGRAFFAMGPAGPLIVTEGAACILGSARSWA
jgi:hypothetical protein